MRKVPQGDDIVICLGRSEATEKLVQRQECARNSNKLCRRVNDLGMATIPVVEIVDFITE